MTNPNFWRVVTAGYAVGIAVVSIMPIPRQAPSALLSLDKLIHVCEYGLLAWCLMRLARADAWPRAAAMRAALWWPAGYGALLEILQGILPYRSAEWTDVLANALGAVIGMGVGLR